MVGKFEDSLVGLNLNSSLRIGIRGILPRRSGRCATVGSSGCASIPARKPGRGTCYRLISPYARILRHSVLRSMPSALAAVVRLS